MNSRNVHLLRLALVAVSVLLILGYPLIPERKLSLFPSAIDLYTDNDSAIGGNSQAGFIAADYSQWSCTLRPGLEPPNFPSCRIGFTLTEEPEDWTQGRDLSSYDRIRFHYDYEGPAKFLRVHFRNFDKQLSNAENYNSAKFIHITLRDPGPHINETYLLAEFRLADWWIQQFSIPTQQAKISFERVTSLEIDFGEPVPFGDHKIRLYNIELIGKFISKDRWYLLILSAWMLTIVSGILLHLRNLRTQSIEQQNQLKEMNAYANELNQQSNEYRNQAIYDTLTGVLNRAGAMQIIESSFNWRKNDDKLALLIIDADLFKQVNDTYGHGIGDIALRQVGQMLLLNTRTRDTVARWGGEEFMILCPLTPREASMCLAEKLRAAAEKLSFDNLPDFTLTISIGLTIVSRNESFDDAFSRADKALYEAKNGGRNRWAFKE
ncbi:GGDEF domain-containing protein [Teredinibacter franksiae]|uniref:GGDEF domain-containing protein n=1 Tax=Teredinibacter franksiae TaxID=2761453 RepID=UPI00162ADA3C|nr:GGDEF domain-containing protein [Teredinibacter franksiae]